MLRAFLNNNKPIAKVWEKWGHTVEKQRRELDIYVHICMKRIHEQGALRIVTGTADRKMKLLNVYHRPLDNGHCDYP
jgi:hypothetical protein